MKTFNVAPIVLNLAMIAASVVTTAACETLSKKYEKESKQFLSNLFDLLTPICGGACLFSVGILPLTVTLYLVPEKG